jgi:hypothetical protein
MRTGLTYSCIYSMLWSSSDDSSQWRYKRRHTVLGLWHQIKASQWWEHIRECEEMEEAIKMERIDAEEARAEREAIIAADMCPDEVAWKDDLFWDVPF